LLRGDYEGLRVKLLRCRDGLRVGESSGDVMIGLSQIAGIRLRRKWMVLRE
jgi:hypothetical protein